MARIKYWQYIVDEEGRPVQGARVHVYEAGTDEYASIYVNPSTGSQVTSENVEFVTDSNGFITFYIGDEWELSGGYTATQKIKITWSKAGIRLGQIDNIDIFPQIFQVDETDNTSLQKNVKNKLVSNALAKKWEDHRNATYASAPHDLRPVQVGSQNTTYNRLVSNSLMTYLYNLVASAGGISIEASAATYRNYFVSTWAASGDEYYVDVYHFLGREYPVVQLTADGTDEIFEASRVQSLDTNTIRVWIAEDIDANISVVG